eukprot:757383-Hanusia_phi.AAC.8
MEEELRFNTLKKLLVNNELKDFDPVKEVSKIELLPTLTLRSRKAFKVYDPHETGYVDIEVLRSIFVK